jgi:hypothetical protein
MEILARPVCKRKRITELLPDRHALERIGPIVGRTLEAIGRRRRRLEAAMGPEFDPALSLALDGMLLEVERLTEERGRGMRP